ncbi:MAG TPA: DUF4105 domain-containing protein [Rhodanobacteraceae bacterium]|nr:DUF4105 domain-containing protein [Rhodanobacteraceae bacterium]
MATAPPWRGGWRLALAAALLGLLPLSPARADLGHAPGEQLRVELITYGPGSIYWERFGHDAIAVTDTVSGESLALNYGVFDFAQKDFLLNFARGHMRYSMGAVPTAEDIAWFASQGRSVTRQRLALSPAQKASLRDYLLWNLEPAHADYSYDYYLDNCATRVRDALDRALGGRLRAQWQGAENLPSYRWQTDRLLAAQPWLMLLVDLGLGPEADRPLSRWDESFLPGVLMRSVAAASIAGGNGSRQPLVASQSLVVPSSLPAPPDRPPNLLWPLGGAGIVLGLLLARAGWRRRRRARGDSFAIGGFVFALVAGLIGVVLTLLWTATAHHAAWANQNLLLFNPLALLLLPGLWRLHRPARACGRFTFWLAWALGLMALAALVGKWLGLPWQHNFAWIAFALPLWAALLAGLQNRGQSALSRRRSVRE